MLVYLILSSTGCPDDKKITDAVLNDDMMPLKYTAEELRACLKNVSLENHLSQMLDYPFSKEQLAVLKENLDQVMPG